MRGWVIVGVVIEDGESASSLNRPKFSQILEQAKCSPAPFDRILVHSLSRAFRSLGDQESEVDRLACNNVVVTSMTENIEDEHSGPLLRKVLGLANEFKSHDARTGTLRGMSGTARAGYSTGATAPHGYRSVNAVMIGSKQKRVWEMDPVEAEVVRLIFRLASVGDGVSGPLGVKGITDYINARGFRTRAGNLWGVGTVHEVLTRADYTGERLWNVLNKNGRENPDDKVIRISVPVIIEKDVYDRVQELLQSREPALRAPRLDGAPSLFGGLIKCARCKGAMVAGTGTSRKGVQHTYYECQNRRKKGPLACEGMRVVRPVTEAKVMEALMAELITSERICALLTSLRDRRLRSQASEHARIASLQREAMEAQGALDQLYALIEKAIVSVDEPTLVERMRKSIERRDLATQARDRALAAVSAPLDIDPAAIEAMAWDLRNRLTTGDVSARKGWLSAVVDQIFVSEDKIQVVGRKSNFQPPIKPGSAGGPSVRISVQEWCRKRDSNPRPPHYE